MLEMSRYDSGDNDSGYKHTKKVDDNFSAGSPFHTFFLLVFLSKDNGATL